jgi:hypothetical protein
MVAAFDLSSVCWNFVIHIPSVSFILRERVVLSHICSFVTFGWFTFVICESSGNPTVWPVPTGPWLVALGCGRYRPLEVTWWGLWPGLL